MGWLFYTNPSRVQGHSGEKAEITRICTTETEERSLAPIQLSKVGSTWYAAIKITPKPGFPAYRSRYVENADGSYVFAAVFLVRYDQGCFGYKDMEECMGPVEARAPLSLINKLSELKPDPTIDSIGWANKWRDRCRAYAAIPTYTTGDIIELKTPLKLSNGKELKTLRQARYTQRGRAYKYYVCQDSGGTYRLSRAQLAGSRLVKPAAASASPVLAEFAERQSSK